MRFDRINLEILKEVYKAPKFEQYIAQKLNLEKTLIWHRIDTLLKNNYIEKEKKGRFVAIKISLHGKDKLNMLNQKSTKKIFYPVIVPTDKKINPTRLLKYEVLAYYSQGKPKCNCCGEETIEFLTLDHINNDGCKAKTNCGARLHTYDYLKRNNYPEDIKLQVLCLNCNLGRARTPDKKCPHKNLITLTNNLNHNI